MSENFSSTVGTLFKGMDTFLSSKTVVGEAITIGDTIILPLVDVSFGVAAGAFAKDRQNQAAGGMGGKMTPFAVLVISNGQTKLVNIKNQDSITKILDMVPDFVDKFANKKNKKSHSDEVIKEASEELTEMIEEASTLGEDYEA